MGFQSVKACQIYDSRSTPTVKVVIVTDQGHFIAQVPSGASKGSYEAFELRDGDAAAWNGKEAGVSKAVGAVNDVLGPALVRSGLEASDQIGIDKLLCQLDGTPNKSKLGANAILGVSMAACRAGAAARGLELFEHIALLKDPNRNKEQPYVMPVPCTNQLNGGVHSGNALAPQEFMVLPIGATSFREAMKIVTECYQSLKGCIVEHFGIAGTGVGDEGGFAPPVSRPHEALDLLVEAAKKAGHTEVVGFAVDPASQEFFRDGKYDLDFKCASPKEDSKLSPSALSDLYTSLLSKYPIKLLEDPFGEDDWSSWTQFTAKEGAHLEITGDDLLATNVDRIAIAVDKKACNSLLLKINQIGTITEAIDAAAMAFKNDWSVFVSHRSGETTDDFIADLTVGLQTGHLKSGAPCRGERLVKYLRLLEIEELLGSRCTYAGRGFSQAHRQ